MKTARIRGILGLTLLTVATLALTTWLTVSVVIPSYAHPSNRTYTSRLGYPALLRARNEPFPVSTAVVEERSLEAHFLGEGLMCTEPVQVPVIREGRIVRVHVREGDRVTRGQLLAEIDPQIAEIEIARARASIEKAKTTLERTKVGSLNDMPRERPENDKVRLEVARQEAQIAKQIIDLYENLAKQGAMPLEPVLKSKMTLAKSLGEIRAAELDLKMSAPGKPLSVRAAELEVEVAELRLKRELQEFKDYKIHAAADGVVAQVLIHEGEYERGGGNPAFTLAVGKWFGAYLDQTAIGRFDEGTTVDVRLEAFPGRVFTGRVEKIVPIVSYSPGGPEASRPIRPLGTGSPEWPATFTARVILDRDQPDIVPGLTGFAEVRIERRGIAVPQSSLASVAAGRGIAYVVDGSRFRPQEVTTGIASNGWIEVLSGLKAGEEIIAKGHEILKPGDPIAVTGRLPRNAEAPDTAISQDDAASGAIEVEKSVPTAHADNRHVRTTAEVTPARLASERMP